MQHHTYLFSCLCFCHSQYSYLHHFQTDPWSEEICSLQGNDVLKAQSLSRICTQYELQFYCMLTFSFDVLHSLFVSIVPFLSASYNKAYLHIYSRIHFNIQVQDIENSSARGHKFAVISRINREHHSIALFHTTNFF